jgi:hypothetical protein
VYRIRHSTVFAQATPLYPQKLALASPSSNGRSVSIVRSRTKATELLLVSYCFSEHVGVGVTIWLVFEKCSVPLSVGSPSALTEWLLDIPGTLSANFWIIPGLGYDGVPPNTMHL